MDCVHHWKLETSGPGGTPGRCRDCGAERTFPRADSYAFDRPVVDGPEIRAARRLMARTTEWTN